MSNLKLVKIFISSTFRDMHSERDYLTRIIFPRLREKCWERNIVLQDVDLRWGITSEQSQSGETLKICLDEINNCRPFFISLLGSRYGWVPDKYIIPDEPEYDWVKQVYAGYSITHLEILHGVLNNEQIKNHAFFYFRDPSFLENVPENLKHIFTCDNIQEEKNLNLLKDQIIQKCPFHEEYTCFYDGIDNEGNALLKGLEEFGEQVYNDLWSAISKEYPYQENEDQYLQEKRYFNNFIEDKNRIYLRRENDFNNLTNYANGCDKMPLVITGVPGIGKSALLANFYKEYSQNHKDVYVTVYFVGISPHSPSLQNVLTYICKDLMKKFNINYQLPQDTEKLIECYKIILELASSKEKILIIVDNINQLYEDIFTKTFKWIPNELSENIKFIISSIPNANLDTLIKRNDNKCVINVTHLSKYDSGKIAKNKLAQYRKSLNESKEDNQMDLLLKKHNSNNPLYLDIACEELRLYGNHIGVSYMISKLPDSIPLLLDSVIERLENDFGKHYVKEVLCTIECSRIGIFEFELIEIIKQDKDICFTPLIWAALKGNLKPYLRSHNNTNEGILDFYHQQIGNAVYNRYLLNYNNKRKVHRKLAEYYSLKIDPDINNSWNGNYDTAYQELPFHIAAAQDWNKLAEILCDIKFIINKCCFGMVYDLINNYKTYLDNTPKDFAAYNLVKDFHNFIQRNAYLFVRRPERDIFIQQALNEADESIVYIKTRDLLYEESSNILKTINKSNKSGLLGGTFFFEENLHKCKSSSSGMYIAGASSESPTIVVWERDTQIKVCIIKDESADISSFCWSPNEDEIATLSSDGHVKVWNSTTGSLIQNIRHPDDDNIKYIDCSWSPDGQYISIVNSKLKIDIWDRKKCTNIKTFRYKGTEYVNHCWSHDSRYIGTLILSKFFLTRIIVNNIESEKRPIVFPKYYKDRAFFKQISWSPNMDYLYTLGGNISQWDGEKYYCAFHQKVKFKIQQISYDGQYAASLDDKNNIVIWSINNLNVVEIIKYNNPITDIEWMGNNKGIALLRDDGVITTCNLSLDNFNQPNLNNLTSRFNTRLETIFVKPLYFILGIPYYIDFNEYNISLRTIPKMALYFLLGIPYYFKLDSLYKFISSGYNPIFSPSGSKMVILADADMIIWNIDKDCTEKVFRDHIDPISYCVFSPDESKMISISEKAILDAHTMIIWDMVNYKRICVLHSHGKDVYQVSWNIDGKKLLSASSDGFIEIWEIKKQKEAETIVDLKDATIKLCDWHNNEEIIVVSESGQVILYNLNNQESKYIYNFISTVVNCFLSPNKKNIIVALDTDEIICLDLMNIIEKSIPTSGVNKILWLNGINRVMLVDENNIRIYDLDKLEFNGKWISESKIINICSVANKRLIKFIDDKGIIHVLKY